MPAINFLGHYVAQSWSALTMINKVLSENKDIKRIVELGTGSGALTLLLGLNMAVRNGEVLTFDIQNFDPKIKEFFPVLNIQFKKGDVFEPKVIEMIRKFVEDERTLFFCDNGDKKREFKVYSKLMKENDLMFVHDWGTEITRQDLCEEDTSFLEPYLQEEFDEAHTFILSMRRFK